MVNRFQWVVGTGGIVAGVALLAGIASARFVQQPTTKPAAAAADKPPAPRQTDPDQNDFVISPMRVQDMHPTNYIYTSFETTYAEMGEQIHQAMQGLAEGIKNGQVPVTGAPIFVYHGASMDPSKRFTLDVGFPVEEGAKEFGDFKLKKLDQFHCATVLYSGPVQQVSNAYQQLFADLMAAGHEPTDEIRESYLLWEDESSVNNVTLIEVGIK